MRLPTLLSLTALLLAGTVHGLDPAVAYARAIEATWAGILSKQRMLTEYTRVWEKGWGHGDLGIANEKAYGEDNVCLWHFAPLGEAARRGGHGLGKLVDKVKSLR